MQNHHNLVYREEEREMFPTLKHFGVGAIPWSPLARGFVTRPLGEQTARGKEDRMISGYGKTEGNKQNVGRVEEIAKKKGVTMAQIACAWSMQKDGELLLAIRSHNQYSKPFIKVSLLLSSEQPL